MHQPNSQHGLLDDLLASTIDEPWSTFSNNFQELNTQSFLTATQQQNDNTNNDLLLSPLPSSSSFSNSSSFFQLISSSMDPNFHSSYTDESIYSCNPCFDSFMSSYEHQQMVPLMMDEEDNECHDYKVQENVVCNEQIPSVFNVGVSGEKKSKSKKVEGQPSKNLMAERRRRKRLNDRLSMLRSIVPKISKMDRTSILGDTIDYMKELMEKIQELKEQDMESNVDELKLVGNFKEFNMNESQVRNPPKFDVERGNTDTRIQICCSTKPGLLLSTVNTLEAFGLDIQQCVISCFNDFSLQASCSEAREHRSMISCEDMKQILFRNAGYGGRCL